jgi:hypothetical protein
MAEINNALALYTKTPQIDFTTPLLTASKLRQDEAQNALAQIQLKYAPAQAEASLESSRTANALAGVQLANAGDRRNALADYKTTGDVKSLAGQPDLMAQVVQTRGQLAEEDRKKFDFNVLRNAKGAQRIAAITDPAERDAAWREELDIARKEERITDADHRRLSSTKPNDLMLHQIMRTGLTIQQQIELEQKDRDRTLGQNFSAGLTQVLGGGQPAPAAGGPSASATPPAPASPASPASSGAQPRGIRNNNPLNIEAGQFTQGLPGFAGSDGRFAKFETAEQGIAAADRLLVSYGNNQGIDTVQGVINRWAPATENNTSAYATFVSKKLGVQPGDKIDLNDPNVRKTMIGAMGEFENGRPIQVAQAGGGITPQSASTSIGGVPSDQLIPFLAGAASQPGLPKEARDVATEILKTVLSEKKPNETQKNYLTYVKQEFDAGRTPKTMFDYEKELKESGSSRNTVNIDQKAETEAEKIRRGGLAKQLTDLAEKGIEASDQEALVGRLGALLEQSGTGANIAFTDWVRSNTGISINKKAGVAEAANALINYLKPRMRVPGSGASSDRDMAIFAKAIPSLLSDPEGKRIVIETLGGMYSVQRARGEIAQRWQTGDIDDKTAVAELRKVEDPFSKFREFQSAKEGKGGRQAQDLPPPKKGDVVDGYEFLGGNPADASSYKKVAE